MRSGQALLMLGCALLGAGAAPAEPPADFERCEAAVRDHPARPESFRCFFEIARARRAWDEAVRRLEVHLAREPSNPFPKLTLAFVELDRGSDRAEHLFREAAAGFAAARDGGGEVFAWLGLAGFLRQRGRPSEVDPILDVALRTARASSDSTLVARVRIDQTVQAFSRSDFGSALGFLGEAETIAVASGSKDLQARVLADRGYAYWEMGMYRKSLEAYSKQADLLRDLGVRWGGVYEEARARYSIAVLAGYLFRDGTMERIEVVRLAEDALETAVRTGNRLMEANARLLVSSWLESGSAVEEAKRALALAREVGDRQVECAALRSLATRLLAADPQRPEQAFRLIDESIREARSSGALEELARSLCARAAMRDRTGPRDAWLQAGREALEGVERIRDLQPEGAMRARVFGPWAFAYYRFAGQLLAGEEASPDPPGDLGLAFSTIERMRARVLLEELEHAGARPDLDEANPDVRRRAEVLERISRVQKRLLNPTETDAGREAALAELDRLEAEEAALRDAIARAQPRFERLHPSSIADLAAVQARLAPDQALLSFQLPHEAPRDDDLFEEGGSWAVLVTRDRARAFPLPERGAIEDAVAVFLGLCRQRDGSEARAASRLFRDLLEAPLREAGDDLTKLIVVPDGCLHRLPFAALRAEQDAPPLASRLELTIVPSATLWLRWKDGARAPSPSTVLALADPEIAAAAGGEGTPVANPWIERMSLGPLPRARHEARAFARELGRGSQVLFGADASESALKHAHLEDYGVLHLAAHAVVDDAHPERTAVVLAPGEGQEDGLLQLREIVELPLEGRVVVLATCRSASGTEVEGEGVLGLARGFFQAGARVVVGTLWPVRDEDAEAFVEPFARELGRGRSVSSAHAAAVREASLSGAPTAAWAGMVVIGDGDLVPLSAPRGYALGFPRWLLLVAGLALALFYAALMVWRLAR